MNSREVDANAEMEKELTKKVLSVLRFFNKALSRDEAIKLVKYTPFERVYDKFHPAKCIAICNGYTYCATTFSLERWPSNGDNIVVETF